MYLVEVGKSKLIYIKYILINFDLSATILLFRTIQNRLITAVKRRRITNDTFRKEYGYSWDYVIVFKVYDDKEAVNDNQCEFSFKNVLERISAGGLEIRLFYSLKVSINIEIILNYKLTFL